MHLLYNRRKLVPQQTLPDESRYYDYAIDITNVRKLLFKEMSEKEVVRQSRPLEVKSCRRVEDV